MRLVPIEPPCPYWRSKQSERDVPASSYQNAFLTSLYDKNISIGPAENWFCPSR